MANYLTPADRRARTQLMRMQRDPAYRRQKEKEELQRLEAAQAASVPASAAPKEESNGFVTALHTVGDVGANVLTGLGKGLEGIWDLGAGIVGAVGGLFSDEFENDVKEHIAKDHVGDWFGNDWQAALDQSALNNSKVGQIIEGVAQGVGQMLPAVAVSFIPGVGPALGAKLALATTIASAAGTSTEQAFQDGADYGEGMIYGAASGAVEGLTEKLLPGLGGLYGDGIKIGSKAAKAVGKEVADVGIKRVAKSALGEGVEEMISEVANPTLKSIYKGSEALQEYADADFWAGVGEAGIIGMGTSLAYGGTVGKLTRTSGTYADARSVMEHIGEQEKLRSQKGLSQADLVQVEQNIKADQELLSKRLQRLSKDKRAAVLKKMPALSAVFDKDGSINAEQRAALEANIQAAGDTTYDVRYRTATLGADTIDAALKNGSTDTHEMRAFSGEMNAEQQAGLDVVREFMGGVAERSGKALGGYVVTQTSPKGGAYFDPNTRVVIIGVDALNSGNVSEAVTRALESDATLGTIAHEVYHGIEKTNAGKALAKLLTDNTELHDLAITDVLERGYLKDYFGKDGKPADIDSVKQGVAELIERENAGQTLTDAEQAALDEYRSEVAAFATQRLHGNKSFMKKLITTDPSTAEKLIGKIREMRENFKVRKDPAAKAQLEMVRKAEKLFMQGLSEAGGTIDSKGKIHLANREEDEELTRENKKSPAEGKVKWSKSERITVNMSDTERAAILQKKNVVAPVYEGQADELIIKEKDLESNKISLAKAALLRIGEELGVFTDYTIKDVEVKIVLSKENLRESISKEANPAQIAKLLPVLKTAVENAIGIESHQNRYYYDTYTTSFDNLLGGYIDGEYFVPVRFGLKHGVKGETTLYVVIDQKKIKTEVLKTSRPQNVEASVPRSATYSIAQIVPFVNSKDLLRYLPDDMLDISQKKAKWEGIAETIKYTNDKNDKKYHAFIEKGNIRAARDMVKAAARANGYDIEAYHGTNSQEERSVWNVERRSWDTTYSPITVFKRQYDEQVGHFFSADRENASGYGSTVYSTFLMMKNPLVIDCNGQSYNSILFDGKEMDTYEWAEYARKHRYDGVIFKNVRDGVGYGDLSKPTTDYVVFDANRIKSADAITYDNEGNIIPLSERFNVRKNDIRYSRKATGDTVTISKGEMAKLHANYAGEKVFDKKSVKDALASVEAFQKLPSKLRTEFVNRIWAGYNQRLHQQGFEQFTEVMWHQLHATIMQEVGYDELGTMTEDQYAEAERVMDEQIVAALHQIVASGKPSVKARLESDTSTEGYRKQANYWREEHARVVERNKALGRIKYEVEKLANAKMGRYVNAANYRGDTFRVAISELAKMNWRGGLVRDAKIREHFATLDAWYCKDNPLYKGDGNGNELFRQNIKDALSALGNAQNGALTVEELQAAETVIKYFAHEIEAHNTIYKDGKRQDAMPEAKRYIEGVARAKEIAVKCGIWQRLTRSGFARMVADPAMLMRQADGYLNGFFTEQFEALRQGTIDAAVLERELAEEFEKFWEEHKAYGKRYNNDTVTFDGKEMPLQEAISLYMTMHREQAWAGLAGAGFEIDGKDATENISDGFADVVEKLKTEEYNKLPPEELLTLTNEGHARIERAALEKTLEQQREALAAQFTAEDKALISIMEKILEQCRDVKIKIDEIVQGYSNVTGGYYFPIRRAGLAENVDAWTGFEGDRVSNLSINKDTVKNAHKLYIEPVHIVFMRHLKAVSLYHGLGVFTDNFNRLYNLNVNGPQIKNAAERAAGKVVVSLENNAELDERIANSKSSRSKVLREYLVEKFGGRTFTMSDGRSVVMDNTDVKELSQHAGEKKSAQLANLEKLIEKAVPVGEDLSAEHKKFTEFHYYAVTVKYGADEMDLLLNVGVAKNDGSNHLYSITDNKREAPTHYGVSGPVGNRIKSASPANSISQNSTGVNYQISGNPSTVRDAIGRSNKYAKEMLTYFKELKQDVEGISKKRNSEKFYNNAVAYIRSAYATYQLGFNPKVWVTQLSSLIASSNILDADCLTKGAKVSGKDVDEYCRLAWLRNSDNAAAMAQAVETPQNAVQRAGRGVLRAVRDASMSLIGKVDRLVIKRLFAACQVQVEKNGGAKIGTKENKIEAGKMLQRVILETQQNSLATERSAAMRSGDEFVKGFTMFSADAMKVGARVVDAFGELSALKTLRREAKKAGNTAEVERLNKEIKRAQKQCIRATVSLVGVAVFNALIAYGFKWLYRRDEEESVGTVVADTFGNMLGGIPLIRDFYSYFQDGFEMDHFLISTLNDVLGTAAASYELVKDAASGKEVTRQEAMGNMRKVFYAAGQLSGVPVRNVYNVTTGLLNRVSPETGYSAEAIFTAKAYSSDLQKAIEADDEGMIGTIAGLMLDEKGVEDASVQKTFRELIGKGYAVLPRSMGDSITVDGEKVTLSGKQQKRFRAVYKVGQQTVSDLCGLSQFQKAEDAVQAKAIQFVNDVYWELAVADLTDEDLAEKNVLFAEAIPIEKLAIIIATARAIEADKDKSGKAIAGSKKRKVQTFVNSLHLSAAQKYMVMGYLGYSNINGAQQVKSYIGRLGLSKKEQAALMKYSGYAE